MLKRLALLFLLECFCLLATAGGPRFLKKVGNWIDKTTASGIDSTYIIVPREPWQLMLRSNLNQSTTYMDASMQDQVAGEKFFLECQPELSMPVGLTAGIWFGYRGYGLGYQKSLTAYDDVNFSISACGSKYGLSMRLRMHDVSRVSIHATYGFPDDENPDLHRIDETEDIDLEDPISVRSMYLEGYYLFNGRHYSNTAVFDQSVQQIKSAGSLMVGFTFFRSTVELSRQKTAFLVDLMNNVGRTKQWQYAMGVGYAYNWVPQRHWLLSIQAMPMLTFLSSIKTWNYKLHYPDALPEDSDEIPAPTLVSDGMSSASSSLVPSGLARAGVVYNFRRLFVTANGQFSTYGFKHGNNSLRVADWYVNTSIGYRF